MGPHTRNAHMVHIVNSIGFLNGVYKLAEIFFHKKLSSCLKINQQLPI